MDEETRRMLDGDEPAPTPKREARTVIETALAAVGGAAKLRRRSHRVGAIRDMGDVQDEAIRLYRAVRQNDGSDVVLLETADTSIRALRLVADVMGLNELARDIAEVKKALGDRYSSGRSLNGAGR